MITYEKFESLIQGFDIEASNVIACLQSLDKLYVLKTISENDTIATAISELEMISIDLRSKFRAELKTSFEIEMDQNAFDEMIFAEFESEYKIIASLKIYEFFKNIYESQLFNIYVIIEPDTYYLIDEFIKKYEIDFELRPDCIRRVLHFKNLKVKDKLIPKSVEIHNPLDGYPEVIYAFNEFEVLINGINKNKNENTIESMSEEEFDELIEELDNCFSRMVDIELNILVLISEASRVMDDKKLSLFIAQFKSKINLIIDES